MVYPYTPNFVPIGVLCHSLAAKNPKFWRFCHVLDFGILWCRQLVTIWESWTKMHNYKPSPVQRYQNHFCTPMSSWWNHAHKLWHSKAWRTNRQMDRQKPQRFRSPRWCVKYTVIENLEQILAPLKLLGIRARVSLLGGAENSGETHPLNLKLW